MRSLYVMSKNLNNQPRLIGLLSEENGEYQFQYKLSGELKEWFLKIEEFPDLTKKYIGDEVKKFIYRIIPNEDDRYINELLESANLDKYDVWEMLKVFGLRNMKEDAYLYEKLPEGAILYEELETFMQY